MSDLSVRLGQDARAAFCHEFDVARSSIEAEFFSLSDRDVVDSLNRAAARGVHVHVTIEGDTHRYRGVRAQEPSDLRIRSGLDGAIDVVISRQPHALVHGKAAVIDESVALIATANATLTGFDAPGELVVRQRDSITARAVADEIRIAARGEAPRSRLREMLPSLFAARADLRVASEDLSDWQTVAWLIHRARCGHRDRVLVGPNPSRAAARQLDRLKAAGVEVRAPAKGYMHEKFIDAGSRLYVGSANLTRNGIDESYEVGIVADASDFEDDARAIRTDFDLRWELARPL